MAGTDTPNTITSAVYQPQIELDSASAPDAARAAVSGVPDATAAALSRGVNLQGWKFWDENAFVTREMAEQMKADGFEHARIYYHAGMTKTGWVDWNVTQQFPGTEAEINADWVTGQVEGSMQNLIAAGMKVVICAVPDFHPGETEAQRELKLDFLGPWVSHIIDKFGAEDIVIETTNEPAFATAAEWQAIERRVVDIVRSVSPDVTIVSATQIFHDGNWDALGGFGAQQPYADENVVYSAHTYNPVPFTTQEYGHVEWPADPAENPGGEVGWFYGGQHTRLAFTREILTYGTLADAKGMEHWMLGEFGVDASVADAQSRQAYFSTLTQAVERAGGGWGIWKGVMDDHEMPIYDIVWEDGVKTVRLKEEATRESLGLVERAPVALAVNFGDADQQDLLHPFQGASSHRPDANQTLNLADGQMGGAGGSATVVRSGQTVTVAGSGAPAGVGVLDDQALDVTITGVQRAQVETGIEGDSRVDVTARDATVITGGGADTLTVSLAPMAGASEARAWIWTGAGADRLALSVAADASGGRVEIATGEGDDRLDLTTRGGELQVSAGSGDDAVTLAGVGGTVGDHTTVDGGVGQDVVTLLGEAAGWQISDASAADGQAKLAQHGTYGTYLLRDVEDVRFAGSGDGPDVDPPEPPDVRPPAPFVLSAGSGADTLEFKISQDAYQGSAQYAVSVDGEQVGGTFTASAWASAGQSDTLVVKGDWGPGAHRVEVTFLNDKWDGTETTDRNLYVDGAIYNGQAVQDAATALMAAGAAGFVVTGAAAPVAKVGTDGADLFDATEAGGDFAGGGGRDLFVFDAGDGRVVIQDFVSRTDKLVFVDLDKEDVATAAATENGVDGLGLSYGETGSVFLAGVSALAERDMVFA